MMRVKGDFKTLLETTNRGSVLIGKGVDHPNIFVMIFVYK